MLDVLFISSISLRTVFSEDEHAFAKVNAVIYPEACINVFKIICCRFE